MAKDSGEMKVLSDRELDGNLLVLRLAKKEVKKEQEEQPKSVDKGIVEGVMVNGDSVLGNADSVSDHPSQPSAVYAIICPQKDQPQLSVKVEKEGDSMMEELKQLREAAVTNERTLKGKETLLSMLTAKLEEVRKEKKAAEEQLTAEIGVRQETSRQCAELQRRNFEDQQKIAQLTEELKVAKEKPNSMDKETVTDMTIGVHSVGEETSATMQPSRAANAAHLLGIDVQLLEELQPNDWKAKFEQLNVKYLKVKRMYWAEQKVATKLRKKLQDKERDATTEELSLAQFGDLDQPERIEANEAVSSPPVQDKIQLPLRKSQRLLEQQMNYEDLAEEVEEAEDGEEGRVKGKETAAIRRSANGTFIRGRRQLIGEGGRDQKPVPPTKRVAKKKDGASNVAANVPDGVFKCPQCPRKVAFSRADLLASHQQRYHGNREHYRLRCPECERPCRSSTLLERHMRTHTGEKPFKCKECGLEFTHKGNLTRHERIHTDERPFVCAICEKAFRIRGDLVRHSRFHSGETPFSCQYCAKQFKRPLNCSEHEKICPIRAHQSAGE